MSNELILPVNYNDFLTDISTDIRRAQAQASLAVNKELIDLYWRIGNNILVRQEHDGWGAKIIDTFAKDLQNLFPEMKGLSRRNIYRMRAFAQAYQIVPQAVAQLPWGQNSLIIEKIKDPKTRLWYAEATLENSWSRSVLEHQLATNAHLHLGASQNNFSNALAPSEIKVAQALFKDEYALDFVTLQQDAKEKDLEKAMLSEIDKTLRRLGQGFAFVGSQYLMEAIDPDDPSDIDQFYIDLLFFHIPSSRYVVIDLKLGKFKHIDIGQINTYVAMVDDQLQSAHIKPSIGLLLCTDKNSATVAYALTGMNQPIVVANITTGQTQTTDSDEIDELTSLVKDSFQEVLESHTEELQDLDN